MVVSPVGSHLLGPSVVSGQSVDSAFDQNQPIFAILVLPVLLQVLSDAQGSLDHAVQIFRNLRSTSSLLQDSQDLSASEESDLGNSMLVSKQHSDLRWSQSLLSQLGDQLSDGLTVHSDPLGSLSLVRQSRTADTFSFSSHLHSSHTVSVEFRYSL